jgi:hypothetical protein
MPLNIGTWEEMPSCLWICPFSGDKDFYFLEESWQVIGQHRIHRQLLTNQLEVQVIELIRKHHLA